MVTKQRVSSSRWKQVFPVLPSLVKMPVGRGNMQSPDRNTDYSTTNKIWVTQHMGLWRGSCKALVPIGICTLLG